MDDIFADFGAAPVAAAAAVRAGDRKQGFGAGAKDKKQDEADKLKKEEEADKKKAEAEEAAEAERLKLDELPNYDGTYQPMQSGLPLRRNRLTTVGVVWCVLAWCDIYMQLRLISI